jgi:EAL domain-containing protein (putative c-di-GMP-specific phosphodiesterase class I)
MLTELPADIVKLDKEFLKHSDSDATKGMINNVIRLIKDNRMDVVCEGVEIEEQVEFLASSGCDMAQGFYFSRPIPEQEFLNFIKAKKEGRRG